MSTEVTPPGLPCLPRHVGIIMDGNGRWAQIRGLERIEGHRVGADSVREIVRASRQLGMEALTLYAFSAQNWARPVAEVTALMELLRDYLVQERPEIMDNDIRFGVIGEIKRLPSLVREPMDALIADSAKNRSMRLTLALSYGGRESIVDAARKALGDIAAGRLSPEALDCERFTRYLPTSELPPLDLLIRTSGEQRVSNFMLWELAYSELVFTDTLWPDFRRPEFYKLIEVYAQRERRFGLTSEQIAKTVESDVEPKPPSAIRSTAAAE